MCVSPMIKLYPFKFKMQICIPGEREPTEAGIYLHFSFIYAIKH